MPKRSSDNFNLSPEIPDDEVVEIITHDFPHWKLICARPGNDPIVVKQRELGRSMQGIYSLHVAIRYAGIVGKKVLIVPDSSN
jgi:hypothetical protein